jgi:sugar/nucleoside kinase (ribokinase family)
MSAPVPPRLLCVGDLNLDLVITPAHGLVVGSDTPGEVAMSGGGSAANVAAWAVAAGVDARFVGTIGDDPTGALLTSSLAAQGVEVVPIVRSSARSRTVAVIVGADGERSMVSDLDPSVALVLDDLDQRWFDGVHWLHLTGYSAIEPATRPLFAALLDAARRRGLPCSIDPSSADLLRRSFERHEARSAFRGVDVLFPNRDEAAFLTGLDDPAAAATDLLELAATVAVTCASQGAVIATRGEPLRHVAAQPVHVTNALGAGDAFAGGFLAGVLMGTDPAALAVATAARAVAISTAR